ncbi:hypothetical protein [Paraliobacillus sp. JSM ZJ581]|uniref:hypothetical protein n=1 Tax=Paraliobacillus sp. JSM ZJ581 TaxID=3342118 RepID=UPI0035A8CBF5
MTLTNELDPIKNILNAKDQTNYEDEKQDYYKFYRGHIENYQIIEDIFQSKFGYHNTDYKDIMNSFWITYKCFLQLEYPEIFLPKRVIRNRKLISLEVGAVNEILSKYSYPPNYGEIDKVYVKFYHSNFPELIVKEGDTWINLLLHNYEYFGLVHENDELKKFATRTHTIGNIAVVPKGFNSGRKSHDYWDWGMKYLNEFLAYLGSWEIFLRMHFLEMYVDKQKKVLPFWKEHLKINADVLPNSTEDILSFLKFVNSAIEERGKLILE